MNVLKIFESEELLEKKCIFCKSEPVIKETKHLFFDIIKLEMMLRESIYAKMDGEKTLKKLRIDI